MDTRTQYHLTRTNPREINRHSYTYSSCKKSIKSIGDTDFENGLLYEELRHSLRSRCYKQHAHFGALFFQLLFGLEKRHACLVAIDAQHSKILILIETVHELLLREALS